MIRLFPRNVIFPTIYKLRNGRRKNLYDARIGGDVECQ